MVSCKSGGDHLYVLKGYDGEYYIFVCSKCGDVMQSETPIFEPRT